MTFVQTNIPGVIEIRVEPKPDERGFFARTWCRAELEARGLCTSIDQCSISFNTQKGTLRGMHWQNTPYEETKIVRCTQGSIFDVALDLRSNSPTRLRWFGARLSAESRNMMYVPRGCAHGFLTLEDNTEVCYQISQPYHPESAQGVRWDDPAFAIVWPAEVRVISERDRSFANFTSNA